jgi:hypothetical protein
VDNSVDNLWITLEPVEKLWITQVGMEAGTGEGAQAAELLLYPPRYKIGSK